MVNSNQTPYIAFKSMNGNLATLKAVLLRIMMTYYPHDAAISLHSSLRYGKLWSVNSDDDDFKARFVVTCEEEGDHSLHTLYELAARMSLHRMRITTNNGASFFASFMGHWDMVLLLQLVNHYRCMGKLFWQHDVELIPRHSLN